MGRKSNIEKSEAEAEIYEPMDFDEITRRLRNGADIQTLADLHGWGYTKMVQRLQYMEKKHGRQLLTPDIMRPSHRKMYMAQKAAAERRAKEPEPDIKDIKPRWPEESKTDPEEPEPARIPEDINDETLAAVLKDIKRAHTDAVKTLHEHEEMLAQARKSERELRTLLIAMEQLTKGRNLPEVEA